MMFIATATESLRKNSEGDEWKWRLEIQLEAFVDVLGTALRNKDLRSVPPELISKLETLKSRISANRPPPALLQQQHNGAGNDSLASPDGYNSARTSMSLETPTASSSNMSPAHSTASGGLATPSTYTPNVSYSLSDIPAARQLGLVFQVSPERVQKDINHLRKICTEKVRCTQLLFLVCMHPDDY